MGLRELTDCQFGKRVREERERRGWSQQELAKQLSDRGIHVHPSTIAKIEADKKPRAVRLGEVVGIADVFELSIDAMLGRQGPDQSTLTFALVVLTGYAGDVKSEIHRAQGVVADIQDQLDSVEVSFDIPSIDGLQQVANNMADRLREAELNATKLISLIDTAILERSENETRDARLAPGQDIGS